jgi:NAD(P)-dependent dehydrogenase (short-subunit alcohol dehydrogenase family)
MLLTQVSKVAILATCLFIHGTVVGEAEAAEPTQRAVLVTGASTGLGRAIAERLAAEGYLVFAGARKKADLDALDAIENIRAIRLDVTVDEEVEAAVATIRAEGRGLYGLVNNAGVLITGPMSEVDIEKAK